MRGSWIAFELVAFLFLFAFVLIIVLGASVDAQRSRRRTLTEIDPLLAIGASRIWRASGVLQVVASMMGLMALGVVVPEKQLALIALIGLFALFFRGTVATARAQFAIEMLRSGRAVARYDGSRFVHVLVDDQPVAWSIAYPSTIERQIAKHMPQATLRR